MGLLIGFVGWLFYLRFVKGKEIFVGETFKTHLLKKIDIPWRKKSIPAWRAIIYYGILHQGIAISALYSSLGYLSGPTAVAVFSGFPILAFFIRGSPWMKNSKTIYQKKTMRRWWATVIVFSGVVIVFGFGTGPVLGWALVFTGMIAMGFVVTVNLLFKSINVVIISALSYLIAVPFIFITGALLTHNSPWSVFGEINGILLLVTAITTALGILALFLGFRWMKNPGQSSVIWSTMPLAVLMISIVIGENGFAPSVIVASLLITLGVWMSGKRKCQNCVYQLLKKEDKQKAADLLAAMRKGEHIEEDTSDHQYFRISAVIEFLTANALQMLPKIYVVPDESGRENYWHATLTPSAKLLADIEDPTEAYVGAKRTRKQKAKAAKRKPPV